MKMFSIWTGVAALCLAGFVLLDHHHAIVAKAQSQAVASETLKQQVLAAERQGLDALKAGDLDRFANLTADDAVFVDAQGSASKEQVMKNVTSFKLTDYSIDNVKFVAVSNDAGLISYKISEQGSSHGRDFNAQAYVSSLWTRRDGKWLCRFTQETAVPKPHLVG
jgi:uncharacterized protein (TIGR02246 family)